jgi:hypothetical protein
MIGASFRSESFGSRPRSAGVTRAEGSLDAELAETILAESGMEARPILYLVGCSRSFGPRSRGVETFPSSLTTVMSLRRLRRLLPAFPFDCRCVPSLAATAHQPLPSSGKFSLCCCFCGFGAQPQGKWAVRPLVRVRRTSSALVVWRFHRFTEIES